MTRSRVFTLAALVAAGGWSCTPEGECPDGWCGTLVVVTGAEAGTLLPPVAAFDVPTALGDFVFDKLADVGPELNSMGDAGFMPRLARSWEFRDSLTLAFVLDPGARWHDGAPVTASDVAFTFDVYRDTLVNSPSRPRLERIASVTAADDRTVVFRFREPYPEQFFDAVYHMRILPRHALDSVPRDRLATHPFGRAPVGSGPFRFVRWEAAAFVELAADSTYFRGRPGVRRLVWRFAPDAPTALTQVVAGEADFVNIVPRPEDLARVEATPDFRLVPYAQPVYAYIGFNLRDPTDATRPHPLFADRELRRALTMAVDRAAVVHAVHGDLAVVPVGPVTPVLWIYSDTIPQIPFDSARARARLAELGWRDADGNGTLDRDGRPLAFDLIVPTSSTGRRRSAQVIQDQLRRVGVALRITELEYNAFEERQVSGRFDAMFGAFQQDPSPASLVDSWTSAGIGGFNYQHYTNPAFDRLARQAIGAPDRARARALWHEALALINADAPAIWVYQPQQRAVVHRRFEDVTLRPDQWAATMWTWRVTPGHLLPRDRLGAN